MDAQQPEQLGQLGPVLLCKAHTEPYERAFTSRGLTSYFVEVLDTNIINREALQRVIEAGAGVESATRTEIGASQNDKYAGVIVTSSRAADAWIDAVKVVSTQSSYLENAWNKIPFYVVGKSTEKILSSCPDLPLAPRKILGAESGNGEALAHFIISHYTNNNRNPKEETRPLLYLTGDKNRETLPLILGDAGFEVSRLQVYETGAVKDLKERLNSIVEKIKEGQDKSRATHHSIWLVLFAPSTADYVLDVLEEISPRPKPEPEPEDPSKPATIPGFKLVSIGPTTEKHLRNKGLEVAVCSPKPDAESLADSILACLPKD